MKSTVIRSAITLKSITDNYGLVLVFVLSCILGIEYRSVMSSIFIFAFQHFHDHILVEHDENLPHTKFYMNPFMVT